MKSKWVRLTTKIAKTNNKYFIRIFISFILIAISSTMIISAVFSSIFIQELKEQQTTNYTNNIDKVCKEFDNIFVQLRQMNIYLRQSPDINDFLTAKNNDYIIGNKAFNYFSSVTNLNSYLYSIILYNRNMKYNLISGYPGIDINQFTKSNSKQVFSTTNFKIVQSIILRNDKASFVPIKTLSLLFNENEESAPDNAIIMTISREDIEKKVLSNVDGKMIVASKDGEIIFNPYHSVDATSIINQGYLGLILSSDLSEGSFIKQIDNEKCIVSYCKSSETGLYLINIVNISYYTSYINSKIYPFIASTILVFISLCIAAIFLSRGVYGPVKRLKEKYIKEDKLPESKFTNELDQISTVFGDTLKQLNHLQDRYDERGSKIKEDILRDLLMKGITEVQMEEMADINFSVNFHDLFVICILVDNHNVMNNNERVAYQATLSELFQELLIKTHAYEIVNMLDGEIALLLNDRTGANNIDSLLATMENIRDSVQSALKITITIGISHKANNIDEVKSSYQKASEAAHHRFLLGANRVIYQYYNELISSEEVSEEPEIKLVNAVKANNPDLFMENLNILIESLKKCPYMESVFSIYYIISVVLKSMKQAISKDNKDFAGLEEFDVSFSSFETLDQARQWMLNLFANYQKAMIEKTQKKSNKYYEVVESSKSYILQNYNDMRLSVDIVAEQVGYAPYYYSKIFKNIAGQNIIEFIKSVRINKAKEILITTNDRINDIAELVGFPSASHFHTIFKAEVGLTPAEYRKIYHV